MKTKEILHQVMSLAWVFVHKNGYTMSLAMKVAWANYKLEQKMKNRIVRFYYRKVSGGVREAFGSLQEQLLPPTKQTGRHTNEGVFVYFDTECGNWRSFKRANLLFVA